MRETMLIASAALAFAGAVAAAPGLLAGLERGQWRVTSRDGGPVRTFCLGSATQLAQLAHQAPACSIAAVEEGSDRVAVQYICRGRGYGRTTIRRETPALVQIESQGVARGRPFQFTAEGRRVGACR
ncbi:DUF3617 domain-containing protein [Qipengyuania sediminis]|uniref:DUF3617 domain-containing protein n=1 Tax=Qipengyuania sediminis TaxID=1532023 RepID=UPI001F0F3255|nr:DUF3617 family protein [Qipengyuania sediminis]